LFGQIITLGKTGGNAALHRASSFLLKPELLSKVFGSFAQRYAERPGGYTRIHKFGHRPGDNAPHAILELVDNPKDLRLEMTARAIGREFLMSKLKVEKLSSLTHRGVAGATKLVEREQSLNSQERGLLQPKTRWNLQKILRFRDPHAVSKLSRKAEVHMVRKPL
jgi:large subunit ribosomal protein L17